MTVVSRGELWVNSSLDDIEKENGLLGLVFASVVIYNTRKRNLPHVRGSTDDCAGSVLNHDDSPSYGYGRET